MTVGQSTIPLARPDLGAREERAACSRCCARACCRSGRWAGASRRPSPPSSARATRSPSPAARRACTSACAWPARGPGDEVVTTPVQLRRLGQLRALPGRRRRSSPTSTRVTLNIDPDAGRGRDHAADAGHRRRSTSSASPRAIEAHRRDRRPPRAGRDRGRLRGDRRRAARPPVGTLGKAAVFAFYPNKQMTTGEGGMIVTDDDDLAARPAQPRQPGARRRRHLDEPRPARLQLPPRRDHGGPRPRPARAPRRDPGVPRRGGRLVHRAARRRARRDAAGGGRGRHPLVVRLSRAGRRGRRPRPRARAPVGRGRLGQARTCRRSTCSPCTASGATGPASCPCARASRARSLAIPFFAAIAPEDQERVVDALARAVEHAAG